MTAARSSTFCFNGPTMVKGYTAQPLSVEVNVCNKSGTDASVGGLPWHDMGRDGWQLAAVDGSMGYALGP